MIISGYFKLKFAIREIDDMFVVYDNDTNKPVVFTRYYDLAIKIQDMLNEE